jgi:hypothetical protein
VARDGDLASDDTLVSVAGAGVSYGSVAAVLVLAVLTVTVIGLRRRDDDTGVLLACGYLIIGFFTVASGVHERYNVPALTFLIPAMLLARQWSLPVLALSLTATANAALTLPFQRLYPQGGAEWMTITVAMANVGLLAWMTLALLRGPHPGGTTDSTQA